MKTGTSKQNDRNGYEELLNLVKRLATFDGCYGGPDKEPMDYTDYRLNVKSLVDEAKKLTEGVNIVEGK